MPKKNPKRTKSIGDIARQAIRNTGRGRGLSPYKLEGGRTAYAAGGDDAWEADRARPLTPIETNQIEGERILGYPPRTVVEAVHALGITGREALKKEYLKIAEEKAYRLGIRDPQERVAETRRIAAFYLLLHRSFAKAAAKGPEAATEWHRNMPLIKLPGLRRPGR